MESEERLHDLGERVRLLEKEREDILTKLEDKQREVDDLAFRLEEESITKADLEVRVVCVRVCVRVWWEMYCIEFYCVFCLFILVGVYLF